MHPSQHNTRGMGKVMAAIAWVIILVMLTAYFSDILQDQQNPNRDLVSRVNGNGRAEVILERNRAGHYVTPGLINGQAVTFLLDTGATGVAISERLAQQLGLSRGQAVLTETANGRVRSYLTRLDQVSVGDIVQYDVRATIAPGLSSEEVLLGMSFLRHLEIIQKGDTLTLRD